MLTRFGFSLSWWHLLSRARRTPGELGEEARAGAPRDDRAQLHERGEVHPLAAEESRDEVSPGQDRHARDPCSLVNPHGCRPPKSGRPAPNPPYFQL